MEVQPLDDRHCASACHASFTALSGGIEHGHSAGGVSLRCVSACTPALSCIRAYLLYRQPARAVLVPNGPDPGRWMGTSQASIPVRHPLTAGDAPWTVAVLSGCCP